MNLAAKLFGTPQKIFYKANHGFNGVDTSGILILDYENFIASCIAAKDSESPSNFVIQGDNGYIRVNGAPNVFNAVEVNIRGEEAKIFNLNQFENRMVHEFIEFGKIFETGDYSAVESGLQTSLDVVKILETAADSE